MKVLRWFGLTLAVAAFSFLLWILAVDLGAIKIVSDSGTVKKIMADSGLYKSVVNSFLDATAADDRPHTITINDDQVPLSDPIFKSAANAALPPEFIQQNVEQVIDSFDAWLKGDTDQPEFTVDLTAAKANFAKGLADGIQAKLAGLPACADGTTAATFNPFTATCLPAGVTAASAAASVQNGIAGSSEFLGDTVYTSEDLKDKNGQPLFANTAVEDQRSYYDALKGSPFMIGILTLMAAAAIFFLSSTRRRGARRVGIVLLLTGVSILLLTALINSALSSTKITTTDRNDQAFQESALKAGKSFMKEFNRIYYPLGGVYAGIGAALVIGSLVIKPRGPKHEDTASHAHEATVHKPTMLDEPDEPMPDKELEPDKPAPKPPAKPKPAPKPTVKKIKVS